MSCLSSKNKITLSLCIGKLEGRARETSNKKVEFISFTKIPYGIPPLGDRRFLRPERFGSWEGTRDASSPCPKPVQFIPNYGGISSVIGEEDCLYLNVYTPDLPVTENQKKFPVIVWIYGGNYLWGDASERFYFPKYLIESGSVVIVTLNYRLGPLGFLTLGNETVPGNMGLWDQRLAMEWIRTHIGNFGGDADEITLMGHDAGSVCITNHMVSKSSAGLFHKAICMSGTFVSEKFSFDVSDPASLNSIKEEFAKECGINNQSDLSDEDLLVKLQSVSLSQLIEASNKVRQKLSSSSFLINPWAPVMDSKFTDKSFFSESQLETIKTGEFNKMPILMGTSRHSGIALISEAIGSEDNKDRLRRDWTKFYFDQEEFTEDGGFDQLINAVGDAVFLGANDYFIKAVHGGSAQPIYLYNFDHMYSNISGGDVFSLSTIQLILKLFLSKIGIKMFNDKRPGISHWDELFCIFSGNDSFLFKHSISNQVDQKVANIFTSFIINFASSGNPTSSSGINEILGDLEWEFTKKENDKKFLSVSSSPEMQEFDSEQINFLKDAFKKRYS
ncbi:unnamed protein product [Lepeophtheirus salmonis]|uniref:(salmon louse) hypothetical protein n=1 Tax=Lepeophtheirus salmonis TaxID=72036 RepID=A0A7R8CST9_LEPSM|nr:unnamed protein product [Lepeophtheirus salmonis]CAF2917965.1 unnamed protein product [Lepeophtheirus salmonis]